MIKISAETREMIVWLFNKFGDRSFTYNDISDTISPSLFDKFKLNKFIIEDEFYKLDHRDDVGDIPDGWRLNWTFVGEVVKRRKYLCR